MKFVHGLMIALMLSMVAYVVNRDMRPAGLPVRRPTPG
jgi:hypothetical protein